MEPVVLPKAIVPVTRSDRVKRARPREDSGNGSAFARYLRQKKDDPSDAPTQQPEDSGEASDPAAPERLTEADGHPTKKRVDIRI
jgi:hypothetical protein